MPEIKNSPTLQYLMEKKNTLQNRIPTPVEENLHTEAEIFDALVSVTKPLLNVSIFRHQRMKIPLMTLGLKLTSLSKGKSREQV